MPTTPEGKATSAKNSFKHGLAAAELYIPEHLRPLHDEISEDFTAALQPEGTLEEDACRQLCDARFQMERVRILQGNLTHTFGVDPMGAPEFQKAFDRLHRYFKEANKAFRDNMRELRKLQCERANREEMFEPGPEFIPLADMPQAIRHFRQQIRFEQNEQSAAPAAASVANNNAPPAAQKAA